MRDQPVRTREGRGADAMLAAIATLTAAWPISTLLAQLTWLRPTALLLAVIAVTGVAARSLALRGWQVLTGQLVCSVLAAGAIFGRAHLWYGLPTPETLAYADRLIREAVTTAQSYAAPAPTTPGLMFVVGCSLGLVALAVDYLAVTRASPSVAGLPLLTVFLAGVANRGSTLPLPFFFAAAAIWLVLVARTGSTMVRRWPTTVTTAQTPVPQDLGPAISYAHASAARVLGVVALAAAVAVPTVLPQLPPTFLLSGLGRSSTPADTGSNTLSFSQSIDLAADLKSPSRAPVLQYTTADPSPPPLRVTLGSDYRADPGLWLPWGRSWRSSSVPLGLSSNPRVPEPAGLSAEVPRRTFAMSVRRNLLEDPYLAVPYPLVGADLSGVEWGADDQTQSVRVARRPGSYTLSYLHLEPTATMLRTAPSPFDGEGQPFDLDLRLDGPYADKVTTLTGQLTNGKASAYDKAMAIQQYLRADGGFTYSLALAPPGRDESGNGARVDALTNFLDTRAGYCVQFATAMVMMSRSAGIPARMAIGFLPGTEAKGVWTILAADAHAWPELYLDGVGWTRFEPTPSRGAPPAYALPASSPGTAAEDGPPDTASAPGRGTNARNDPDALATGNGASQEAPLSPASVLRWLTHGWGPTLMMFLTVLLGSTVVPTAALWRRRRSLRRARTDAQRVEVRWELLTSSLFDLGIPPAPSRTPRQLSAHYGDKASLDGPSSLALDRVVQTLERSRYAVSPPPSGSLAADARQVRRAAASSRRGQDRLRAALWPSTGVTQLRSASAHVAGRIRAPLSDLSDLVHRRGRHRQEG